MRGVAGDRYYKQVNGSGKLSQSLFPKDERSAQADSRLSYELEPLRTSRGLALLVEIRADPRDQSACGCIAALRLSVGEDSKARLDPKEEQRGRRAESADDEMASGFVEWWHVLPQATRSRARVCLCSLPRHPCIAKVAQYSSHAHQLA
jgi:hypothetical protein